MSVPDRLVLAAVLLAAMPVIAPAQETPATKPATTPAPRPKPALPPGGDRVLATVDGEKILYSEIAGAMNTMSFQPGEEQLVYDTVVDHAINARLLSKFLDQQKIPVSDAEIQAEIEQTRKMVQARGMTLEAMLAANDLTLDELKKRESTKVRWRKYVLQRATEAELRKYFDKNKDIFSESPVRASHILMIVDENASETDKTKAREKLLAIKKEIDEGKISFPDAANKYSEDPGNKRTPNGGDLGYFTRKGRIDDDFAKLAFAERTGKVSDPVETRHGYHLILVTDRREGHAAAFDQLKDQVLNDYAADLQMEISKELRSRAKIKIEPMPADFRLPEPKAENPTPKTEQTKK